MKQYAYILIMCLTATLSQNIIALELIKAIEEKKYKKVRQLIRDGADVNCNIGFTPLHCAAFSGLVRITKLLLEHGANVNARNFYGETALCLAAGYFKIMKLLLQHRANENGARSFGNSLWHTIRKGQLKCTKLLMQYGADPMNIRHDNCQTTALHIAAYHGRKRMLKYFLEYGIPVNMKDEAGRTPLNKIFNYPRELSSTHKKCIRLLLDHEADAVTYFGWHHDSSTDEFIQIWAYARAQGKEDEFIRLNQDPCQRLLSNDDMMNQLEQETRKAHLRMLCIKHGEANIQDLLFKRETGMIRLP